MSNWGSVEPLVEKNHVCKGLEDEPWFRIIQDDGCYMLLLHVPDDPKYPDGWRNTDWIFPEAFDELVKLPRPRGAIYDITRDGPLPAGKDHHIGSLVAQRHADNEKDRAEIERRLKAESDGN